MKDRMNKRISIIVPVYNAAKYIVQTIDMVCRQTYEDWELLLVNDCSTDKSAQRVTQRLETEFREVERSETTQIKRVLYTNVKGQRIILLEKKRNEGAAKARNTGVDAASGRYIAFLDADDVWYPEKLAREMSFMEENKAGFVFSAYEFGDERANPTGKVVHVPRMLTYKQALSRTVIFTTTVLIDLEVIPVELIHMPAVASEDTATWWQILKAGFHAYGLDEVLAVYRRPGKSLSSNKLVAIKRIWWLYRRQQGLSVIASAFYFVQWAYRATVRRI